MTKYLSAKTLTTVLSLLAATVSFSTQASVTPDRTRLIFNESDKSISVTLRNNDPKLPYLAQSWIEDEKGVKISSPLAVLPPVQRIEAMMNGQVKIQGLPDIHKLPADRGIDVLFQRARNSAEIEQIQHATNRSSDAYQTFLATESSGKKHHAKPMAA